MMAMFPRCPSLYFHWLFLSSSVLITLPRPIAWMTSNLTSIQLFLELSVLVFLALINCASGEVAV